MPAAPPPDPPITVRLDRLRAEIMDRPAAAGELPAGEPLYQAVRDFTHPQTPRDDITAVIIKVDSAP